MEKNREKLILVTNDDGIDSKGLMALIEIVRPFGKVVVVAPSEPQSGMSHAITVKYPLRVSKLGEEKDIIRYCCIGTPVDCVKLALNKLLERKPDLIVSGVNHGANSSTSIMYSGTMAAALEGCVNEIPSIGFSLLSLDPDADFSSSVSYGKKIVRKVINDGIPDGVCLNVNIPDLPENEIAGVKIVRQNKGHWQEEFDMRTDPSGRNYYWLTGFYKNTEPGSMDTDEWALENNYISIVPTQVDLTSYSALKELQKWNFNGTKDS